MAPACESKLTTVSRSTLWYGKAKDFDGKWLQQDRPATSTGLESHIAQNVSGFVCPSSSTSKDTLACNTRTTNVSRHMAGPAQAQTRVQMSSSNLNSAVAYNHAQASAMATPCNTFTKDPCDFADANNASIAARSAAAASGEVLAATGELSESGDPT